MAKTPVNARTETVEAYLKALPKNVRETLEKLRQTIKKAAPKSEEKIWYHIPSYMYKGPLVHFAAFKDHCSLIGVNRNMIASLAKELEHFRTTGTTIHFTPDHPIPATIVRKIVKTRMKQNEERIAIKQASDTSKKAPSRKKIISGF